MNVSPIVLTCRKCKLEKPATEFPTVKWDNTSGVLRKRQCSACKRASERAYRERTREKRLKYLNNYYYANIEKFKQRHRDNKDINTLRARENTMRRKFGMDYAARDAMLKAQGGVCAICKTDNPGPKDWHIDHCHTSNRVRGILCHYCNVGLGHLKDDPNVLRLAAEYLERNI